jgi:hypothetical protein
MTIRDIHNFAMIIAVVSILRNKVYRQYFGQFDDQLASVTISSPVCLLKCFIVNPGAMRSLQREMI